MSGGRLEMTPYPEGALVPPTELHEGVKTGTVEMANICAPYFSGVMPIANLIYGFPGTYRSYEDMMIHHREFGFADVLRRAFDAYGLHYLGDSPDGGYVLVVNKPVTKVADFQGMKLRATGAVGETFKQLGASVIYCPGAELYTAVATGVVEGCVYGGPHTALDQMKLAEVVDYVVMPYLLSTHGPLTYVVNKDAWNALPDDLKAIVETQVQNTAGLWFPIVRYNDLKVIEEYVAAGKVKVSTMPEEEFNKFAQAARKALERLVADKNDPFLTEGAETLVKFMEWRGYW